MVANTSEPALCPRGGSVNPTQIHRRRKGDPMNKWKVFLPFTSCLLHRAILIFEDVRFILFGMPYNPELPIRQPLNKALRTAGSINGPIAHALVLHTVARECERATLTLRIEIPSCISPKS